MEIEPQHEHQSDLEHFFSTLSQIWSTWGRPLALVVLVVLVCVAGYRFFNQRQVQSVDRDWENLASASGPASYLSVSDEANDAAARNLARLRGADQWLELVALPPEPDDPDQPEKTPEEMLGVAERAYQQILADEEAHSVFKLNAMLGLASVAESRQDWPVARDWYEKVQQQAGNYTSHRAQAEVRQERLDRLAEPLTFGQPQVTEVVEAPDDPEPPAPASADVAGSPP